MKLDDQILIVALRLRLGSFEAGKDFLDAVDAGEDQADRLPGDRHAVAEFTHQGLAGMRQRFQPRQPQKSAGALDGVDETKDVIQNPGVVRILLEPDQLIIDGVQALARLRQELAQQVVHEPDLRTHGARTTSTRLSGSGQLLCKAFNIG